MRWRPLLRVRERTITLQCASIALTILNGFCRGFGLDLWGSDLWLSEMAFLLGCLGVLCWFWLGPLLGCLGLLRCFWWFACWVLFCVAFASGGLRLGSSSGLFLLLSWVLFWVDFEPSVGAILAAGRGALLLLVVIVVIAPPWLWPFVEC